jgi:hypothetical protein
VSEIIEVAMAKNRDERYASTEDMLEDLRAVRAGLQPVHARRVANLDQLAQLEEKGKTVDITPAGPRRPDVWSHPMMITALAIAGVSVLVNIIQFVIK